MGAALVFIFKSSLVLLAMYLVYKLLMSRDNAPAWNRGVLLSFYIAAPLIAALTYMHRGAGAVAGAGTDGISTAEFIEAMMMAGTPSAANADMPVWGSVAVWVWIGGMAVVTATSLWALWKIASIVRHSRVERREGYRLCITDDTRVAPFSAWRTVVLTADDTDAERALILQHELRHIALGHRFDLLLSRLVIVLAWFNPASWLMAEELKAVHEYQADAAVLRAGADARQYQMLLIKKAVGRSFPAIANSLNHSNLKKRITMMLKSKSASGRRWRLVAVAPAIAVALLFADMPAVASAMNTVAASQALPQTTGKVTNISANDETKTPVAEEKLSEVYVVGYNPATDKKKTNMQMTLKGDTIHIKDDAEGSRQYSVTTSSKNKPVIYVNDELYTGDLNSISPSDIASMRVLKDRNPDGEIFITLKNKGDEESHLAQFEGGDAELFRFIAQNIQFPTFPKDTKVPESARVVVQFTITAQGKVINPTILRGSLPEFDREALNVVGKLPDFIPATDKGTPIETTYTLPVMFKYQ